MFGKTEIVFMDIYKYNCIYHKMLNKVSISIYISIYFYIRKIEIYFTLVKKKRVSCSI